MIQYIYILFLALLLCATSTCFVGQVALAESAASQTITHNPRLYGHIYWENGFPARTPRRPDAWLNPDARANPDVIIQTGYYNLRFDADNIALTGYDAEAGSDYLTSLHEEVTTFSLAPLLLVVYKNGIPYVAQSGDVGWDELKVRLIEQGRYVQRFDHVGIVFKDAQGNTLDVAGYFEITAWPDRVVYMLDFSDSAAITRTTISITSPDGDQHLKDLFTNKISLAIQPHNHNRLSPLNATDYVTEAYEHNSSTRSNSGQLLATMLAAQELNDDGKPIYGAYVVERNWFFVVLQGKSYCMTDAYVSTKESDLKEILRLLKAQKLMINERISDDSTIDCR